MINRKISPIGLQNLLDGGFLLIDGEGETIQIELEENTYKTPIARLSTIEENIGHSPQALSPASDLRTKLHEFALLYPRSEQKRAKALDEMMEYLAIHFS